ncbi:LRP1B [Branchiostoma lanceolatum]|uniref:LRP1B protein n=1 Tax=Branchiostoma lanceolatum TaxID=7740 RepID=A0A8J9ZCF2_BRALA|nr:LRP1B [Branchiostoma lanceolatum]
MKTSLLLLLVAATFLSCKATGKKAHQLVIQCMYPHALPCTNRMGCILEQERCDGIAQCMDGSDEDNCLAPKGYGTNRMGCILEQERCDGIAQCMDGSDEDNCLAHKGYGTNRMGCILEQERCDGIAQCMDGSDEDNCLAHKGYGTYRMGCILEQERCDGIAQCMDGSDEDNCLALNGHGTNRMDCILEQERCDGIAQCMDGSDEDNCLAHKGYGTNRMGCILEQERCDRIAQCNCLALKDYGIAQCMDGSDEESCPAHYAKHGLGRAQAVMKPQAVVAVQKKHHPAPFVVKSHPAPAPVKGQPVVVQSPKQVMLQQVVNLACQTGYVMGEDRLCYRFSSDVVKYAAAERACAQDGAGLAVLKDEVSHGFVYGFLQSFNPHNPHWIGLDDRAVEGQYVYADGTALGKFNHWDTAQPDDEDRDEDCVQMQGYYWNDKSCCEEKHFICQAPPGKSPVQMQGYYWNDKSCCEEKHYICQAPPGKSPVLYNR